MKKIIDLLFLLLLTNTTAQVINIPDNNFKTKLLQASPANFIAAIGYANNNATNFIKIDANNDGEIQQSEALVIKFLDISGANISNLEGLQYFTNLKSLLCVSNLLNTLSPNGLTNLEHLAFGQLIPPTVITVSGFPNLKSLFCTKTPQRWV